jgi:hypothetical protein
VHDAEERYRVAVHEAGHAAVAHALGWPITVATIEPGTRFTGTTLTVQPALPPGSPRWHDFDDTLPAALWPPVFRAGLDGQALVYAAGQIAAEMFAPRTGRLPAGVAERAAEILAAAPQPSFAERDQAAEAVSDPDARTDAEHVADIAGLLHWRDPASAAAWLDYTERQAAAVLALHAEGIARLAAALTEAGTVGGEAAVALLTGEQCSSPA